MALGEYMATQQAMSLWSVRIYEKVAISEHSDLSYSRWPSENSAIINLMWYSSRGSRVARVFFRSTSDPTLRPALPRHLTICQNALCETVVHRGCLVVGRCLCVALYVELSENENESLSFIKKVLFYYEFINNPSFSLYEWLGFCVRDTYIWFIDCTRQKHKPANLSF